jgi:hypothetical protein
MHFHNDHVLASRQSKSKDLFSLFHLGKVRNHNRYRTHPIIGRGSYIFYPIFHCGLYCRAVSIIDNLCANQGNSSIFEPKICGLKLREFLNQEQVIMARLW